MKIAATGAVSALALGSANGCSQAQSAAADALISATAFNFHTMITLQAACSQATMDAALTRCNELESLLSRTIETSDIGRINASCGQPIEVSTETAEVISKALAYAELSGGAFDISMGAVTSLWDFDRGIVPAQADIDEALTHVDWRNIHVDGTAVTLADPAMKLDLGGIAKGYIADELAQLFADAGCQSALINLGGNVYALGDRPDGQPWNVGVQDPGNEDTLLGTVETADESTVASGIYEQQFTRDGVLYHHILDVATGYPSESDIESVSVVADRSVDADAWATTLFLMGSQAALDVLNGRDDITGLIVKRDGTVLKSDGCPIV